jgi:UDP-glucose 4-epimerase
VYKGRKVEPLNWYALTKLFCEKIANLSSAKTAGLRIFAGYGPGEGHKSDLASVMTKWIDDISNDRTPIVFGDGSQVRDFVYIDDIIDVMMRLVQREEHIPQHIVIDVGSGESISFIQLISLINRLLKKNIIPQLTGSEPQNYVKSTLADISSIRNELSIRPLSAEEGLTRYLKHLGMLDNERKKLARRSKKL